MTEPQDKPGIVKRFAPWLAAIAIGVGFGWWFGTAVPPPPADTDVAAPAGTARPAQAAQTEGGGNAPPLAAAGPPIAIAISNRDCNWGADFQGYYQQAATIMRQAGARSGQEAASVRVRVPDRPWNGLTVRAVEAMYEGSGIIFAEPMPQVRAALAQAGVRVAADGGIPLDEAEEAVAVQTISATSGSAVRYGATALVCGV